MRFESLVFYILGGLWFVGSHTVLLQGGLGGRLPPPPYINPPRPRGSLGGVAGALRGFAPQWLPPTPAGVRSPPPPFTLSPPPPSPWGVEEQISSNTDVLCSHFRLCWGSMFPRVACSVVRCRREGRGLGGVWGLGGPCDFSRPPAWVAPFPTGRCFC